MFKRAIILVFLLLVNLQAQKYNFETHTSTLKGELTKDDIFDHDFGRFDAYELPMEEGDLILMELTADFFPLMTIVSPSSEYQIAFPSDSLQKVVFKQEIDETGLWQVFIVGDSTDFGNHSLKLFYVSREARKLPEKSNICTLTNLLLAHSKTQYFYFREENNEIKEGEVELKLDSQDLFKNGEVFVSGDTSTVTLYFDEIKTPYNTISAELKKCLKGDWNRREKENELLFVEIEGLGKITLVKEKGTSKLVVFTVMN